MDLDVHLFLETATFEFTRFSIGQLGLSDLLGQLFLF
jgi:hypothetical protein